MGESEGEAPQTSAGIGRTARSHLNNAPVTAPPKRSRNHRSRSRRARLGPAPDLNSRLRSAPTDVPTIHTLSTTPPSPSRAITGEARASCLAVRPCREARGACCDTLSACGGHRTSLELQLLRTGRATTGAMRERSPRNPPASANPALEPRRYPALSSQVPAYRGGGRRLMWGLRGVPTSFGQALESQIWSACRPPSPARRARV